MLSTQIHSLHASIPPTFLMEKKSLEVLLRIHNDSVLSGPFLHGSTPLSIMNHILSISVKK